MIDSEGTRYRIFSRCVRQRILFGTGPTTGKDFAHGRDCIDNRILALADNFTVMANPYLEM